MPEQGF